MSLTDHLLTPYNDLQETPLINVEFSWCTDDSCLEGENDKYCTGYATATPFEVAPLPSAIYVQQAELCTLTRACILVKGRTTNMYTDSGYTFGVAHDFGKLWKQ